MICGKSCDCMLRMFEKARLAACGRCSDGFCKVFRWCVEGFLVACGWCFGSLMKVVCIVETSRSFVDGFLVVC